MKRLFSLYLSADGRISRNTWWLSVLALVVVEWAVLFLLGLGITLAEMAYFAAHDPQNAMALAKANVLHAGKWIALGVAIVFFVPFLQIGMKRRHDRRRAGADFLAFSFAGLLIELADALGQAATVDTANGKLPTPFGIGCVIYALFALYILIVLGFRRGVPGPNVYGPEPVATVDRQSVREAGAVAMAFASPWRPAEVRTQNPLLRYWQGGYPLGPSFWFVNVLVGLAFEIGLPLAVHRIDPGDAMDPAPRFWLLLASGVALACFTVWLRVGVWRSAQRRAEVRRRSGPNAFWPRLAQVLVVPPLLFDGLILYFIVVFAGVYYPIAFEGDPDIPDYTISVLQDGKALSVVGGVKFGLAGAIEAALDDNPAVHTIYLQSPGGRLGAAEQVARLVSTRGLDTYVADHCESACTRIFVAGSKRMLRVGGRLGFHSGRTDADVPSAVLDAVNQSFAAGYIAAGVDAGFMRRAEAVSPQDIWYPTDTELLAAHVVTVMVPGEAGSSPGAAPAAASEPPPDEILAQNRSLRIPPHTMASVPDGTISKDRH